MMKRQFTCSYANCQNTNVPIIFTMSDERARYCCIDHALMGTVRRAWIASFGPDTKKTDTLSSVETILRGVIGDGLEPKQQRPADMRDSPLRTRS